MNRKTAPPAQYLLSVVNNPRSSWLEYLGLQDMDEWTLDDLRGSVVGLVSPATGSVPAPAPSETAITLGDFQDYLQRVGEPYRFLASNRSQPSVGAAAGSSSAPSIADADAPPAGRSTQLGMIPDACFSEDFELSRPETFALFSPPDQPHTTMVTLERLTHYLDQARASTPVIEQRGATDLRCVRNVGGAYPPD
mgnify:CR=1 FL=1